MFIIILIIMIKKDVLRHNDSILFLNCKLKNEFLKELTSRKVRPNGNANGNILTYNI